MNCLECSKSVYIRGLCRSHYEYYRRKGEIESKALPLNSKNHRLTNKDEIAKTAICSICGPTGMIYVSSHKRPYWHCRTKKQEYDRVRGYQESKKVAEIRKSFELEQNGKCKVCNTESNQLHLDHCHSTGKFRGLLCLHCNTGLGQFKDNIELLESAIQYLKDSRIGEDSGEIL